MYRERGIYYTYTQPVYIYMCIYIYIYTHVYDISLGTTCLTLLV